MTRSELQEYDANEPIWGFVAQLGRERFTGQVDVGATTRIELFATEGRVYFAQKVDDPPLGARLVATGALTTEQLRNGSVKVGDTVSLARLFTRVPELDRDAVELMADRFTQQVLEAHAHRPVGLPTLHPFRHHPSGIQQWYRDAEPGEAAEPDQALEALVATVVAQVSGEVPVITASPTPRPETMSEPMPVPVVAAEPVAVAVPEPEPEVEPEPAPGPITFETLVTAPPVPETALPTLSTLTGLTPLPTLGEVGTRMPTPAMVHTPAPMQVADLPSLGKVGVSFHPAAVAEAEAAAPSSAKAEAIADPTVAELEAMVGAPSAEPRPPVAPPPAPVLDLEPGAPLPPPVAPPGLSPLDLPSFSAMMAPTATAEHPTSAPAVQETEQIWDMVDDLLGLSHPDASLVDAGTHESEKKGRGWLRGRRG